MWLIISTLTWQYVYWHANFICEKIKSWVTISELWFKRNLAIVEAPMLGVKVRIGEITTNIQVHAKNEDIGNEGVGEEVVWVEFNFFTQ